MHILDLQRITNNNERNDQNENENVNENMAAHANANKTKGDLDEIIYVILNAIQLMR